MTATRRFASLAEAFLYSSTEGGVIHRMEVRPRHNGYRLHTSDWYVVDFANMEAAFAAGMRIEDDFGDLM